MKGPIPIILYRDDADCTRAGSIIPQAIGWSLVKAGTEPIHERVVGKFPTKGEAIDHARNLGWWTAAELRS